MISVGLLVISFKCLQKKVKVKGTYQQEHVTS